MKKDLAEMNNSYKRLIVFIYDLVIGLISFPLAISIRFGSIELKDFQMNSFWDLVTIVFFCKVLTFSYFKLSRGIWRFSSTPDLILILKATGIASVLSVIALFFWNRLETVPRSSFLIDWFLTIFFLGGGRFTYRIFKDASSKGTGIRTILIGAGEAGEQLIREINRTKKSPYHIVGILDDNKSRHGRTIHGIPVLGQIEDLKKYADQRDIEQVIIAIPSATSKEIRKIINICFKLNIRAQTLPTLSDIVGGKVHISQLRPVNAEDLLGRQPVQLDLNELGKMLSDKVILVTGAGGSIGSELCNQILRFSPRKLILFENCELFLYQTEIKLKEKYPTIHIVPIVGDVRDQERVQEVFNQNKPNIIFHAAAYKHVPMMELNPQEAIKNNVGGTQIVANAAIKVKADRFIMISTDKAVNPTNIMGATKRIAEMICQELFKQSPETKFSTVRFGNVLGSAGSVIPRFLKQIQDGGPVTVTHKEITRYFMSIPEATQLVLQAGCLAKGGEIFVLEMGAPVKIHDLAVDLIKLCGLTPNIDIDIEFTGLRPGEKLYEELLANEENTLPTNHNLVRVAKARHVTINLKELIDELLNINQDTLKLRNQLKKLVPEFDDRDQASKEILQ